MIRLTNVNKYFNRRKSNQIHVINNTSIELGDKGLVTFLGPSGCGKTTLLNAIGGLDQVHSGDIFIDDKKMTTRSSNKRDNLRNACVGYIFQNYNLIEDATVYENVALVLRMMGIKNKKEIEERVMYILRRVGIDRYKNRPAKMLSGGERQRVGIARAIVKNPKIIIADEPTGNLDSKNTIEIMNIIKAISRDRLVILVTHEREIAQFYADRIVELIDGKIVSDKENVHDNQLDYHFDNKIYLQDLPVQQTLEDEKVRIKYYCDNPDSHIPEIKVVIKSNTLYIEGPSGLSEGSAAVELVDDHYKKLSKDVYEDYEFNYDKMVDQAFQPKYTSIFNPVTMLVGGFKKIFSYSLIKKLLLCGYIMASMFVIYAISNVAGVTNVTDDEFTTIHHNYLTVNTPQVTPAVYEQYASMEYVDYVLPGDSMVYFTMPLDDFYQSYGHTSSIRGSLASSDSLFAEDALLVGRGPSAGSTGDRELVIDKMVADQLLNDYTAQMVGINSYEKIIGRTVYLDTLGDFTIVGITDQLSPSIYARESMLMNILIYQGEGGEDDYYYGDMEMGGAATTNIMSYDLVKDNGEIKLAAGTAPDEDYEVLIHYDLVYEHGIGKQLDTKINGQKLRVCGYYTDSRGNTDRMYVTQTMAEYAYMETQRELVISSDSKAETFATLSETNVKVTDNYEHDRSEYLKGIKRQVLATVFVAVIILLISLIEMYLMLRSSFLSRIKEVGVLRAIGLKKRDIHKMFLGEIIALTFITTLPGMAIMGYILEGISNTSFGENLMMNPGILLFSFALVLFFNVTAGLLPVHNTLRKTPAAILARNDVN